MYCIPITRYLWILFLFPFLFKPEVIVLYVMWLENTVIDVFVDIDGATRLVLYLHLSYRGLSRSLSQI